nr:branched-chain amino acid ABC transporter permease [Kosmotoga arenicorallina]
MKLSNRTNLILTIALVFFVWLLLFFAEGRMNTYMVRIVSLIGIYGIMAVSLTLINGITGIFSLGHSGFIALGAYTSALLTMSIHQKEITFILDKVAWPFNSVQLSFLPATIIGGIVAAVFSFLIGWPSLRLSGDYLAIATLGFSEIIRILALNLRSITNGALGLKGIPQYTNVWWSWSWLLITVIFIGSLVNSSFGRALKAIREDRVAAASMGINVFKHQLLGFVIGGFFAGISGSLYAHWLTTIDPRTTSIGVMLTFNVLIMIVIGGLGSISGAIIGAGLFAVLTEWLRFLEEPMKIFSFEFSGIAGLRMLVFSAIFVIVMIFWPRGIMGRKELTWNAIYSWFRRGKGESYE